MNDALVPKSNERRGVRGVACRPFAMAANRDRYRAQPFIALHRSSRILDWDEYCCWAQFAADTQDFSADVSASICIRARRTVAAAWAAERSDPADRVRGGAEPMALSHYHTHGRVYRH